MPSKQSHAAFLASRQDLKKYGSNARLLFALETRFRLADIHTVATDALTDSKNDKKCDLVYIDREDGICVIAQGYEATGKKQEAPANKASDLNTAVSWLLSGDLSGVPITLRSAAQQLRDALAAKEIRSVQLWYVHNLKRSKNVESELHVVEQSMHAALAKHFPKSDVDECTAIEVDSAILEDWYLSLEAPILVTEKLQVTVPGAYSMKGDNWEAAVTSVPATWLHELWQSHGTRLFSANVRDYLGSRKSARNVNNNIKETATGKPRRFWVYNNGITALVNDFQISEETLTLHGISIVNGAQTTGALGSLGEEPPDQAFVQARFVKCGDGETVQRIIQYNNTQNVVKVTDFRSNDAVQRRLRNEFNSIPNSTYLGGRRGGEDDLIRRPGNLIPTDTCSQALASFHQEPGMAYNRKSEIWESDALYSRFFSDDTTAQHIVFVFSLLRTIEESKRALMALDAATEQQQTQLAFLRNRGATFLLAAATAACIEILLGKAVPNRFRLSFGNMAPDKANQVWQPVVDATMPFAGQLLSAVNTGLKNRDEIAKAIANFRAMVQATTAANTPVFRGFAERVVQGK